MAAFERMEEKVLMQEARAQCRVGWCRFRKQFAALESGSDVDDELAALKLRCRCRLSQNQASLPPASGQSGGSKSNQVVDSDLEQLKSSWINYSRSHLFSLTKGRGPCLAVYQFLRSLY